MPGLNPLVDKIRAAHPGAYDDLDDAQLTKAVLAKYPQYEDLAAPHTNLGKVPVPEMEQSVSGALFAGPAGSGPGENLPSPKAQMAKDTKPSPAVGLVALAGGAGSVAAPVADAALATPAGKEAIKFALKHALEGAGLGATYAAIKHLLK